MTTGAALLIVLSLVLFLGTSIFAFYTGLLFDAHFDPLATGALGLVYFLMWALPSLLAWVAWAHFS